MALAVIASVSGGPGIHEEAQRFRELHWARATAELADADAIAPGSDTVAWRGSLMPAVAVVKGLPGPAEESGGAAVSGADGVAAVKALEALGFDGSQVFFTLSRPARDIAPAALASRLRAQIEAVDASVVVALDVQAAEDLAAAFDLPRLTFGVETCAAGRRLVAVDGLEASLGDTVSKRRVWEQIAAAKPQESVF